jgi:transcriptional regulator with XRE-family HTH domain
MPETATDREVARLRELLRRATRLSGVSNKEIERRLNMSSGSLSRLFAGGIELKVKHVLDILKQIDMPPAAFFHLAFPDEEEDGSDIGIALKGLLGERKTARKDTAQRPPAGPTQEEIEEMVTRALRKMLLGPEAKTK